MLQRWKEPAPFLLAAAAVGAALPRRPNKAAAVEMSPAAKAVADYDKAGDKPARSIASLTSPSASTIRIVLRGWLVSRPPPPNTASSSRSSMRISVRRRKRRWSRTPSPKASTAICSVRPRRSPAAVFTTACSSRPASRSSRSTSPCAAIRTTRPASQRR